MTSPKNWIIAGIIAVLVNFAWLVFFSQWDISEYFASGHRTATFVFLIIICTIAAALFGALTDKFTHKRDAGS